MRRLLVLLLPLVCLALCACGATEVRDPALSLAPTGYRAPVQRIPGAEEKKRLAESVIISVDDPLVEYNQFMYRFNAEFDRYVFLPAVDAYRAVLPQAARTGVANVFDNVNDVAVLANCLLQAKGGKAATTFGRILLNTTFGLGGLVDVATPAGLDAQDEDFGQTLGFWGVPAGPYFVLPVAGPSSFRDTAGLAGDSAVLWATTQAAYVAADAQDEPLRYGVSAVKAVSARDQEPMRYYASGTPFEYEWVRFLYLQKRELDVQK